MKKAVLFFLVLFSIWLLSGTVLPYLNLNDAPITPELVKEIQYRNSLVRGYGWLPTTPSALPTVAGTFVEDTPYDFDFQPYINLTAGTTLDSLRIGWSQSSVFTITRPDEVNHPFLIRFTPASHFFGTRPVWITIYQVVNGDLTNPVSTGINVTVTNQPTSPEFSFPSVTDPSPVHSGYVYSMTEDTTFTLDFKDIVTIFDGNVSGTTPRNFDLYITQTTFPNMIQVSQSENNNGQIVTFTPNPNYFGTQYFIVTAVDKVPPYQWASTTFGINVVNVNDDPVITSFLPPTPVLLNQGDSQAFSVVVDDPDADVLAYTWTLEGTLNGAPLTVVDTAGSTFNYAFINPGFYTLTLVVDDGHGASDSQVWQITVSPAGPQFDPAGAVFSTSVMNASFGTQGVHLYVAGVPDPSLAVIHFTTTSTDPTVTTYPTETIYTGPILIPVPPENYNYTITAWFTYPGQPESQHNTQVYTMTGKVQVPDFVQTPGIIPSNVPYHITITCPTPGSSIHYSYDNGPWTLYAGPISVPDHTVAQLRAYASKPGWIDSDVSAEHVYDVRRYVVFNAPHMYTVPAPDGDGNYCVCINDSVWIDFSAINAVPPTATIYYQIQNGINTGLNAVDPYASPEPIQVFDPLNPPDWFVYHSSTILWWAEYTAPDPDYLRSDIHRYPIPVRNRTRMNFWANGSVFDPPAGTYTSPQSVSINTATVPPNATIYYSLDGGAYQVYTGVPISIAQSATLEVYADPVPPLTTLPSLHQTAAYNITGTLPQPLISPAGFPTVEMYEADVLVTISLPAGDPRWAAADIYYTTDGSDPTILSNHYTAPFTLIQGQWTVKAIAVLTDWNSSGITHQKYYIKFLPPVTFFPTDLVHYSDISVTMNTYNGSQIRYTENGEEPIASSSLYAGPISLL